MSNIVETIDILIRPKFGESLEKDPQCDLFTSFGKFEFTTLTEAIDFAMTRGKEEAIASARASGARDIVLEVKKRT